jgi:hypothetical protein
MFSKTSCRWDYLMNIMSGDEAINNDKTQASVEAKENK